VRFAFLGDGISPVLDSYLNWSEKTAHNRLVLGSSPSGSTYLCLLFCDGNSVGRVADF